MRLPSLRSTSGLASRAGVGLKPQHYRDILESRPDIGFFEVHAENYMGEGGPPHRYLETIRADYPLSLHGVGLSLGSAQPLDREHLARLRRLVDRYQPHLFSEHLAWSTHGATYFNDLLPLPYTTETLQQVCAHIDQVQDALARRLLLENPATYVQFAQSTLAETDFLAEVVERTGCSLLLDVNNVFVSASNHDYDAASYIDAFPLSAVAEIHLAGCSAASDRDARPLLIDDHGSAVKARVWELYARVVERAGPRPTLIEWDNDVPCWPTLHAEALKAQRILDGCQSPGPIAGSANAAVG